jgi:hypothetical protein
MNSAAVDRLTALKIEYRGQTPSQASFGSCVRTHGCLAYMSHLNIDKGLEIIQRKDYFSSNRT